MPAREVEKTRRSCGGCGKGNQPDLRGMAQWEAKVLQGEISLAPCCWLLFAPRSKPQHLWEIIHWRKEDKEVKKRRRLELYRRMLPKFPR